MQIIYKNIKELKEYDKNPRKNDQAVAKVAESIKNYGFKNPIIIDKNNVIVAGHTRLRASKKLGIENVPCIVADDLTEDQLKAFRIADNKVAEYSTWDQSLLKIELQDVGELFTGFNLIDFEDDEENIKGEVEFTEVLGEEHNYLILYFDNSVDWLQAESLLELKEVKNFSTRKDGKISDGMLTVGIGRVLKGRDFFEKIRGIQ